MQVPRSCNHCRNSSGAIFMGKSATHSGTVGGLLNTYVTFPQRRLLVVRQTHSVVKDDRKTIGGPARRVPKIGSHHFSVQESPLSLAGILARKNGAHGLRNEMRRR